MEASLKKSLEKYGKDQDLDNDVRLEVTSNRGKVTETQGKIEVAEKELQTFKFLSEHVGEPEGNGRWLTSEELKKFKFVDTLINSY